MPGHLSVNAAVTSVITAASILILIPPSSSSISPPTIRPNFVFLFLDDLRLDDMIALPRVRDLITDRGVNVTNFFVNTPVCCPSRATLLSGRYPHNNRVKPSDIAYNRSIVPCCMHMNLLFGDVNSSDAAANPTSQIPCSNPGFWRKSLPVRMQKLGYQTGLFGKLYHMGDDSPCGFAGNNYGPAPRKNPTILTNTSKPFMLPGTTDRPEEYATSLIANKTVEWLRDTAIPLSKQGTPFFAYVPLHPPHGLTTPAPWYNETWPKSWGIGQNNPLARAKPNYGYLAKDHHWVIANEPPITPESAQSTQKTFVERLQMLLSVDDAIDGIADLLEKESVIRNTYMLFCADHGWNLGEFRVMNGKHQMYEHTIRVPFAITGPSIPVGVEVSQVMAMVDIAPTLLELGGAKEADFNDMDGRSFAPVLLAREDGVDRTAMMVEFYSLSSNRPDEQACRPAPYNVTPCLDMRVSHSDIGNNTFIGLRIVNETHDLTYAEYVDVRDFYFEHVYWKELYDVKKDPFQMKNLYYLPETSDAIKEDLHYRLRKEFGCSGSNCQW
eukprot:UC4_evm1s1277